MIDQNRVSLSRYPRLSPLPLTFLRKACGEVRDSQHPVEVPIGNQEAAPVAPVGTMFSNAINMLRQDLWPELNRLFDASLGARG
jgi:hypothetical protein